MTCDRAAHIDLQIKSAHMLGPTYTDCRGIVGRPISGHPPKEKSTPVPQPRPLPKPLSPTEARRKERAQWWQARGVWDA